MLYILAANEESAWSAAPALANHGVQTMRVNRLGVIALTFLAVAVMAPQVVSAQDEIEEVIVTATKRAASIQDVNIAINAFTADDLADFGWTDVTQVANQSPNLEIKYAWGNSMPIYTIRGVGMNSFQASDTPSVGLFIDEIYQTSLVTMGTQLFDMERVEVLKGPQGALFGRNTNGGAVSYISKRPSAEQEGYLRGDIGNYNLFELEGAFGGPVTDNASARFSFMTKKQLEGWVTNRTTGADIGEVDIFAARLQVLWDVSEDTSVHAKLFASRDRSQPVYFQHMGFWTADPSSKYCSSWQQTRIPNPTDCIDLFGYSDTDRNPYAGDYTNRPDTVVNDDATLENDILGGTLTVTHSGEVFDVTSLTSFTHAERFQPKESDAVPELFVDFLFASDVQSFSQEFRLSSKDNDSPFSWIAGLVYSKDDVAEDPPRILYADDWIGIRGRVIYDQSRESWAVYGQGEWSFSDQWRLTAGARAINEDISFESEVAFLFFDGTGFNIPFVLATLPNPAAGVDGVSDDSAVTGRISLDYMPNDDMMFYASYARGYKGGGFNGGFVSNPRLYLPFGPEKVNAFELGYKSTWQEGRLIFNAAAFFYDYEGLQAATARPDPLTGTPLNFLTNLEAADVTGFEAEVRWLPTDQLEVFFGAGFLDTENNDPGANFDGVFGNAERKLANSPDTTYNLALAYDRPLENGSNVRFFTDFNWQDDHYKEIVNNVLVESQALWNGRITWTSSDERLSVSVWGKNLADEEYVADTLTDPVSTGWGVYVYGMPRTYGVSATYRWGADTDNFVAAAPMPADSDGDGVPDDVDRCPGTPPGTAVDATGCERDSDGDGVVDSKDRCPGTPRGVPVDENGCPKDSDGDGVHDGIDECPDTPAGVLVDVRGCEIKEEIRLRGVNFEYNSADLTASSRPILNEAAATLEKNPSIVVEVAGHTDSAGSEGYNQGLSERRAASVHDYLVGAGIAEERLSSRGYGESQPIADNDTDEGRAENRRVVLRIIER